MRALTTHWSRRIDWRNEHAARQDGRCAYCHRRMAASGRPALHPTLDHIVPLHRGGADTFENTSAACRRCNSLKDAMTVAEFASAYPDLVRSAPSSGFAEG